MSALHKSLDETLTAIREQHEREMQECKDRTLAADVRAELLQKQLDRAIEARATAERVTTKLIAQFGMVESVFAEAKALALSVYAEPGHSEQVDDPNLPEGTISDRQT